MIIDGIDLLFVIFGFILFLLVIEGISRLRDWAEWDQDRRRERKHDRLELQDKFAEKKYRQDLRFIFTINNLTGTFGGMIKAMKKAENSAKEFSKTMANFKIN